MTIAVIQGTRPEIIKNYSITKALTEKHIPFQVLHTNQHTDANMRDDIYHDMNYQPDQIQPMPYSIGGTIDWIQNCIKKDNIHHIIVNGDTAAALAGAIAALYSDIRLSHIEAGLRCRDIKMLEERNRIMVDATSNLLFSYTQHEQKLLSGSPDIRGAIFTEGNTTVDVINDFSMKLVKKPIAESYLFVTLHRRELTESHQRMKTVIDSLNYIANNVCKIVFPVHPRTLNSLRNHSLDKHLSKAIKQIAPMTAVESLRYQKHALAVLTDSGCIQEEAYMLGTPCITVRENTERHLTISNGANVLSGFDKQKIIELTINSINSKNEEWPEIYGKPGAGMRIVERIMQFEQGLYQYSYHKNIQL